VTGGYGTNNNNKLLATGWMNSTSLHVAYDVLSYDVIKAYDILSFAFIYDIGDFNRSKGGLLDCFHQELNCCIVLVH